MIAGSESTRSKPARVILYTRAGCHLCDDARELLNAYGIAPHCIDIDIDADPALRIEFDTCVPVVEINGRVRFRGRVDEVLLRRLLRDGALGSSH
jgi:glutaredoxin